MFEDKASLCSKQIIAGFLKRNSGYSEKKNKERNSQLRRFF
jgi:hypothetical protein